MKEGPDARGLPEPTAEALAHSRRLQALIGDAIDSSGGAIRFAEYMHLALYAPGLGYYSAGSRKFGSGGDYVTAPERSPLFAACIARSCARVLESMGGGDILEIGAGSGRLALDLLQSLESIDCLPDRYRILEVSADLRDRQRQLLCGDSRSFADRIDWIDYLPEAVNGVIFGNEVLDALPFERFRIGSAGPEYLGVTTADGGFHSVAMPADESLRDHVELIGGSLGAPLATGYTSEWCPALKPFVGDMGQVLRRGVLLLIDYGLPRRQLYQAERADGTLMCHYRHRAHGDPFFLPGLQDITAWVDFTSVAEAGSASGLTLDGFTTQAHYLLACGIAELAGALQPDTREGLQGLAGVRALTLPGQMGERFKVIGFSRGWPDRLPGLTGRDLSGSL